MFDPTSRYFSIETARLTVRSDDGTEREVAFKKRRFIPPSDDAATLVEHTATQGERLDNITAHYIGDPTQFWRICDSNNVLSPEELEETGKVIRIALPHP